MTVLLIIAWLLLGLSAAAVTLWIILAVRITIAMRDRSSVREGLDQDAVVIVMVGFEVGCQPIDPDSGGDGNVVLSFYGSIVTQLPSKSSNSHAHRRFTSS